jgi:hypothetical protein
MASSAPTNITLLPRGHELPHTTFTVSPNAVEEYTRAVGDGNAYNDSIPPLAAVALGLAALQEHIALPEGSLHTGQEVEQEAALRTGVPLTLTGRVAQRSERQGFVVSVIEFEIAPAGGAGVRARATIMAPGGGS